MINDKASDKQKLNESDIFYTLIATKVKFYFESTNAIQINFKI